MTPRRSFTRKIAYLVAIAVLLVPLFWLSQPATIAMRGEKGSPGGKLAQLRTEYGLSETQFGEIDPTSETAKLATCGMRGVAANILWSKAFNYKKKKDWTNLSATLVQISKLEPHFITVWLHQSWNLSYNVSAEFDDYRERYRWVIKGVDFLKKGVEHNRHEPMLSREVGRCIAQKIGRADEHKQFRVLFREDDDFHANDEEYGGNRPLDQRDNWLVGKYWFGVAADLVDNHDASLKKVAPLIFFSEQPMCQMNYAGALEEDGIFEERAMMAWKKATRQWREFGDRELPGRKGILIHLNDKETNQAEIANLQAELDGLAPGRRDEIYKRKLEALTDQQREAYNTPEDKRTGEQYGLAREASRALGISDLEVARLVIGADRKRALAIGERIAALQEENRAIDGDRHIVNFEHWRLRAEVEQLAETIAAREFIYDGNQALARADLPGAKEDFDKGLEKWRKVLDREDLGIITQRPFTDELMEIVVRYRRLLEKRDEQFPDDFILKDVVDMYPPGWEP